MESNNHSITIALMTTSKSPLAIARVIYETAKKSLPLYSHTRSPHLFTLAQIISCLVLKEFFNTDYRGIAEIITDSSDICKALELKEVPHFTTLQKASRRVTSKESMEKLMKQIITMATKNNIMEKSVSLAAMDGTGYESRHTSHYFIARRTQGQKSEAQSMLYSRFPKIGLVADTFSHLILAGIPDRGPRFDINHFKPALHAAVKQKRIHTLVADAGYDSEESHMHALSVYNIEAIIPAIMRRWKESIPKGEHRRSMHLAFPKKIYGQRWQIETVISMLKRHLGSFLRARTYWSQNREMLLKALTHNVMVVWRPVI